MKKQTEQDQTKEQLIEDKQHLEELLFKFIIHFYQVFDLDWDYAKSYINYEEFDHLLSPELDNSNWGNRDLLIALYNEILALKNKEKIVDRLIENNEVEMNLIYAFHNKYIFKD